MIVSLDSEGAILAAVAAWIVPAIWFCRPRGHVASPALDLLPTNRRRHGPVSGYLRHHYVIGTVSQAAEPLDGGERFGLQRLRVGKERRP